MPHDLPAGKTVYHSFRHWRLNGTWQKALDTLRPQVRRTMGREEEPSAAIIDSQSIKTSPIRGNERGFDGGKKIFGRKRHVLVDTQGLLLAVKVHAANVADRSGARLLLEPLTACFERVSLLFADHGYDGDPFGDWLKKHLGWDIEIVPQPEKEARSRPESRFLSRKPTLGSSAAEKK